MSEPYSYFDESYFQDGSKRGTAYVNYRETARVSQIFYEIAQAMVEVFQPKRVLDVGCATGMIVRRLNDLGCEAHGIDVSEWAIANAEHPNVRLASADNLPYPDSYFDLVISCHSMEHLPDSVLDQSLNEITRVSSKFMFHMLPMVGTPPYLGDPEIVREQLRTDPTHQQLHSKEWWIDRFKALGCVQIPACILLKSESANAELSTGQFLLKKAALTDEFAIALRATSRNQRTFRDLHLAWINERKPDLLQENAAWLSYSSPVWKDIENKLSEGDSINLFGRTLTLTMIVRGDECRLRFVAGSDCPTQPYADAGEFHFTAKPGCNTFVFSVHQLKTLRGSPDYSKVNHLALGGENKNADVFFFLSDQSGALILS